MPENKQFTILVVDDERDLLAVIEGTLSAAGYNVMSAPTAHEALAVWTAQSKFIDLLLTDFNLETATGMEVARVFWQTRPELPVVFITGNADTIERLSAEGLCYLRKPFSFEALPSFVNAQLIKDRLTDQK